MKWGNFKHKDKPMVEGNPYTNGRRAWNNHVGGVMSANQIWQVVGIVGMLMGLTAVGGAIHIGGQSKFIPYMVEMDKLGNIQFAGPALKMGDLDPKYIKKTIEDWLEAGRLVTPDGVLQRKAIHKVYAHLSEGDPAKKKMDELYNNEEMTPLTRAETQMVSVEVVSTVQIPGSDTWQVDWKETVRDRDGSVMKGSPFRMRGNFTVYVAAPAKDTTEEEIQKNPLGIFVKNFDWTKQL